MAIPSADRLERLLVQDVGDFLLRFRYADRIDLQSGRTEPVLERLRRRQRQTWILGWAFVACFFGTGFFLLTASTYESRPLAIGMGVTQLVMGVSYACLFHAWMNRTRDLISEIEAWGGAHDGDPT